MNLREDNDIHRARLVYLGPAGYPFPFHYTYAQYGTFVGLAVVLVVLGMLVFGTPKVIGFAIALAFLATGVIWRFVNPEQTARNVVKVLATDWKPLGDKKETNTGRLRASHITVRHHITDQTAVTQPTVGGPR